MKHHAQLSATAALFQWCTTTSLSKSYILILRFAVQGGEQKNIYDVCFISFTFILREGEKRGKRYKLVPSDERSRSHVKVTAGAVFLPPLIFLFIWNYYIENEYRNAIHIAHSTPAPCRFSEETEKYRFLGFPLSFFPPLVLAVVSASSNYHIPKAHTKSASPSLSIVRRLLLFISQGIHPFSQL